MNQLLRWPRQPLDSPSSVTFNCRVVLRSEVLKCLDHLSPASVSDEQTLAPIGCMSDTVSPRFPPVTPGRQGQDYPVGNISSRIGMIVAQGPHLAKQRLQNLPFTVIQGVKATNLKVSDNLSNSDQLLRPQHTSIGSAASDLGKGCFNLAM